MAQMSRERFEALAEAYGGDPSRWPATASAEAAALISAEPTFAAEVLARAAALDAALDAWRPAPASQALAGRILAAAPRGRRTRWPSWLSPAAVGAGLAAACAAGVFAGAHVSQQRASDNAEIVAISNTLSLEGSEDLLEGA